LVPAQHLDAGPFIGVRDYGELTCVPCWKDLSPRVSGAYDLFGNGRTALKVSVGRYTTEEMLSTAHNNNPLLLANSSTNRSWDDLTYSVGDPRRGNFVPDCDLKDPTKNGECGPYANPNFGKTIVTNHYDPALLNGFRPYNWATSAVVQHELTHGMALNVGYFRTSWHNQTATDALGVVPADFDPYCVTLPVDSRFPNGGGNTLCGLYNVKPDKFSSLTGNNFITNATTFGKQTDIYSGMDMTVAARLPNGTQLQGGLNTGRQATSACSVIDSPSATVPGSATTAGPATAGSTTYQNNPAGFCDITPDVLAAGVQDFRQHSPRLRPAIEWCLSVHPGDCDQHELYGHQRRGRIHAGPSALRKREHGFDHQRDSALDLLRTEWRQAARPPVHQELPVWTDPSSSHIRSV